MKSCYINVLHGYIIIRANNMLEIKFTFFLILFRERYKLFHICQREEEKKYMFFDYINI